MSFSQVQFSYQHSPTNIFPKKYWLTLPNLTSQFFGRTAFRKFIFETPLFYQFWEKHVREKLVAPYLITLTENHDILYIFHFKCLCCYFIYLVSGFM